LISRSLVLASLFIYVHRYASVGGAGLSNVLGCVLGKGANVEKYSKRSLSFG
jgi:hypothetical protein